MVRGRVWAVLAVASLVTLSLQSRASANTSNVVISQPEQTPPVYNAIAQWNPVTQTACLYSANSLHEASEPWLPWASPGDCSAWMPSHPLEQGIYDVSWDQGGSVAPLIVSADPDSNPTAKVVVIVPDYTWQAYNIQSGGNFYFYKGKKKTGIDYSKGQLNLLRPNNFVKVGAPAKWPTVTQEFPAVNPIDFLRANSVATDVIQQSLLDTQNYDLSKYAAIVVYGHDEYWTAKVRSSIDDAVKSGTGLLDLAGNTGYRKLVRTGEVIHFDTPTKEHPTTSLWGDKAGDPGPTSLLGVQYLGQPYNGNSKAPLTISDKSYRSLLDWGFPKDVARDQATKQLRGLMVTDASSPIFAGTGLKNGQWFGVESNAVSYEVDGVPETAAGIPLADFQRATTGKSVQAVAQTWIKPWGKGFANSRTGMLVMSVHELGRVFATGSVGWTKALVSGDRIIQQITLNALRLVLRQ